MRDNGVCHDELRIALCEKCGYIQPVLLENSNLFTPPQNLTEIQWLDMSLWKEFEFNSLEFNSWYESKFNELLTAITSNEITELSGDITTLKSLLTPKLISNKESTLLKKEFYGREWIFNEISSPISEEIIAIYGTAGTGKSAISARLQYYLPDVIGSWYCAFNDALSLSVTEFLKTFIFKLAVSVSEYRKYLVSRSGDILSILNNGNVNEIIEKLISLPLQYVIDGGRGVKYYIIDGLDESFTNGKSEILSVINELISVMPKWFKFIVTSRPEKEVTTFINNFKNKSINLNDNKNSISDFNFYLQEKGITDKNFLKITNQNFLLAELVVNSGNLNLQLTNGISNYYSIAFDKIFNGKEYENSVKTALCLLINSVAPVTEDVILNAFNKSGKQFITFIKSLREFLTFGVERHKVFWNLRTITLFHHSFKEWLISNDAGVYKIDKNESVTVALEFYNKILNENSIDVTSIFIKNYELFLIKNNLFDVLHSCKNSERYNLIKERVALNDDFSNRENRVAKIDATKITKLDELSNKISLLSNPIKYHYAKPIVHHAGGAMDDYCEYYIFPCCNYCAPFDKKPNVITETGCKNHYGDISTLPNILELNYEEEFDFWKAQLLSKIENSNNLYKSTYNNIYASTTATPSYENLSDEEKQVIMKSIENIAKSSFKSAFERHNSNIVNKLCFLKDKVEGKNEEFDDIMSKFNEIIKEDIILF